MKRHVRGSSLIESLVALAVFAIGSSAVAVWLAWSMALDARASRVMAMTTIARDLVDRVRMNREGATAGHYRDQPALTVECARGCDAAGLAADDLARFRRALVEEVGARAVGSLQCLPGVRCTVRVTWMGRDELVWEFEP